MTTLLIDTDIVIFQAASVHQSSVQWDEEDEDSKVTYTDLESSVRMLSDNIQRFVDMFDASRVIMCLTDKINWRSSILPSYKQNRSGLAKPLLLPELRDYVMTNYETFLRPTLEADDCLGILSTHPKLVSGKKILISEDKDMQTIPCVQFNPRKDTKPREVSIKDAHRYHMYQTLTGDTVDGYRGCPGVGKVKAAKALDCPMEFMWHSVVQEYAYRGLTEEDALIQARVARICQHTDYNYQTKEVILWNP
jgi:DNA polymerase-1